MYDLNIKTDNNDYLVSSLVQELSWMLGVQMQILL